MLYLTNRPAVLVGLIAAAWYCSGCQGNRNVTVEGTVLKNGQPIAVSPTGYVQVTLHPDAGPDAQFTPRIAECDRATGKFAIRDVLPGKYKIGVEQFDPNPQIDKLNSAFRADTGRIIREIDGKAPLVIDIAKPTGG
jgi:hypothetical protein